MWSQPVFRNLFWLIAYYSNENFSSIRFINSLSPTVLYTLNKVHISLMNLKLIPGLWMINASTGTRMYSVYVLSAGNEIYESSGISLEMTLYLLIYVMLLDFCQVYVYTHTTSFVL